MRAFLSKAAGVMVWSAVLFCSTAAVAHAELIQSFSTDIALEPDSSFTVTETIAYDFEDASRYGIFRTITTEHPQKASAWYKKRYIDIEVRSVRMDGSAVQYEVSTPSGAVEIKIGDPDRTITGLHTYTITYEVRGALFYEDDSAELYWNVTGDEWSVPMQSVTATLTASEDMLGIDQSCYVGRRGSTEQCTATTTDDGIVFMSGSLSSNEGMTIAQELSAGAVEQVVLERVPLLWVLLSGGVLFLVSLIVASYRIRTKHKVNAPIIAQYEPYEDVRPMYAGVLIDGELHPHDVTAGIVYLAEQGFLKIRKTEQKFLFLFDVDDYEIELLKDGTGAPGAFLPKVLELLYGSDLTWGQNVSLSDIKKNLPQQRLNQKILTELRRAIKKDMQEEGFFEGSFADAVTKRMFGVFALVLALAGALGVWYGMIILPFIIGAFVVLGIVLAIVWTRRTRKGYEAQNHLKGFKTFLSVTDKDRFAFHNAPAKSPETFLAYLPYAIAFGVEKEWAAVFKDITIPNPSWYDGGHAGAFSAVAFTSDMSAFSSSLSTSSGTSASSGGGSAGGGAGGGGGGSW